MLLGKFRGVEFFIKEYRYTPPAKVDKADFMEADSKTQDITFDNMAITIDGYIYGDDVETVKIKLEQALNKKSGVLVLPDGRQERVKIDKGSWTIIKNNETDDLYQLDFNFILIAGDSLSLQILDLKEVDDEKLNQAQVSVEKSFLENFNDNFQFEGFPDFVKMQSFDNLSAIADKASKLSSDRLIGQIKNPIFGSLSLLAGLAGGIANVLFSYTNLKEQFGSDKQYFDTYINMAQLDSGIIPPSSSDSSAIQIYKNNQATEELINQRALASAIDEAVNNKEYDSQQEVEDVANLLLETSLEVAYRTQNAEVQNQLNTLLNLGIAIIKKKNTIKTREVSYNIGLPACVLAYEQYGVNDLFNRTEKLLKRNKIRNELFIPASQKVEVEIV